MCSGCSGNYADDYSNSEDDGPDEGRDSTPEPSMNGGGSAEPPAASEADWEVLVSARGIVEIRFSPPPELAEWNDAAPPHGQLQLPSAKTYRTLHERVTAGPRLSRIALLCFGLGALASALLTLWLLVG